MIIIGSDHTGVDLKNKIIHYLSERKLNYEDVTQHNLPGDDYPDIATQICCKVKENSGNIGIAICGTGIGISIACNKVRGIRAALATDVYMAEMSRRHNNSNVLCLGARLDCCKEFKNVENIIEAYLNNFYEAGRHERRLLKIQNIEKSNFDLEEES